jgi:hypothetical protein
MDCHQVAGDTSTQDLDSTGVAVTSVTWQETQIHRLMRTLTFIGPCIIIYSYSKTNKMHLFHRLFILVKRSTCFGQSFRPSSGAQDCTYSNRHMSNSCCYLLLATGSSSCLTYACCCMCSLELLMMDGKTVRNM